MNLLAVLLPGIRHVRNPFVVGALWAGVAYFLFASTFVDWTTSNGGLGNIEALAENLPNAWRLAALSLFIYLGGEVMMDASAVLARSTVKWLDRAAKKIRAVSQPRALARSGKLLDSVALRI